MKIPVIWNALFLSFSLVSASQSVSAETPATEIASPAQANDETQTVKQQEEVKNNRNKIAETLKTLEQLKEETAQLNKAYKSSKDEEQAVLRAQLRRTQAETRDNLNDLVKNIVELESLGQGASEERKSAASFSEKVSGWLKAQIEDSMKLLESLDEKVKSATENEAPDLRQQISAERKAVDEELTALLDNTDLLETLGISTASDLKYIDDTLLQRADNLVAKLQYQVDQRTGLRKQITGASDDEKKKILQKVSALDNRISSTAENLKLTIALMNERKIEATEYKKVLIGSTGEITKDVFEKDVALGLMHQALDSGKEWLFNQGPQAGFKLLIFFFILIFFSFLSKIFKRVAAKALASSRLNTSKLLRDLFVSIAGKIIFLIGVLIALAQVGIHVGPLLAGLGIVGFILGFALQETLSNFASGIMILIYRPFDVGDSIDAGGVNGKVKALSLVSTTITTFDNQRVIVPNKKIWGDVIRNVNAERTRRIDMIFGIGYDDDLELVERVLHEIVDNNELVLDEPETVIQVHTLGDSTVDFIVRPWVKSEDYWKVYWHITKAVKQRFDKEGISIPFPQQDMHVYHHENNTAQLFPVDQK